MRLKRQSFRSTWTNHLLDLEVSGIYLTGKLFDGLTGVLVGGRVHIILYSTWNRNVSILELSFYSFIFNVPKLIHYHATSLG